MAIPHGPRPFWSGTITFGLVSLPVSLFVATRSKKVSLRMIDDEGKLLARRYFCPKQERALEPEEIVRGYAVEKDKFVAVKDDELDAIAPQKPQEIDLRRFVPVDAIDPMYFERAYFLTLGKGATKPYRLLAKSMKATRPTSGFIARTTSRFSSPASGPALPARARSLTKTSRS
jgi:DNA end-binding protein Ku